MFVASEIPVFGLSKIAYLRHLYNGSPTVSVLENYDAPLRDLVRKSELPENPAIPGVYNKACPRPLI